MYAERISEAELVGVGPLSISGPDGPACCFLPVLIGVRFQVCLGVEKLNLMAKTKVVMLPTIRGLTMLLQLVSRQRRYRDSQNAQRAILTCNG